jgi:hypothetical protein
MRLTQTQSTTLAAAIDRLIPADDWPSATAAGVLRFLQELFDGDRAVDADRLTAGLDALDAGAVAWHGVGFAALDAAAQDAALADAEADPVRGVFFRMLLDVTAEGYYADTAGGRVPASWAMIGYSAGLNRP